MEEESENKLLKFILILFILFLILYLSKETGYYDFKANQKMKLTSDNIERFEKDIKENKDLTKEKYVINDYKDYSNTMTNIGYTLGISIKTLLNDGIKKSLKILSELFYE